MNRSGWLSARYMDMASGALLDRVPADQSTVCFGGIVCKPTSRTPLEYSSRQVLEHKSINQVLTFNPLASVEQRENSPRYAKFT